LVLPLEDHLAVKLEDLPVVVNLEEPQEDHPLVDPVAFLVDQEALPQEAALPSGAYLLVMAS
jgi:hypothetical protein